MGPQPSIEVVVEDASDASAQVDALCAMFERVYAQPVDPRHWHWKYVAGPRLGHLNLVARDMRRGCLLGHIGATIFPGVVGGRPLPMAQVCDVMVEPGARGGLGAGTVYGQLVGAMRHALAVRYPGAYAYGFPGGRPFALGERSGYYRRLATLRSVEMTTSGEAHWRDWLVKIRRLDWRRDDSLEAVDTVWNCVERRAVTLDDPRRAPDAVDPNAAAALRGPLVRRDGPYVAWRYRDHPRRTYSLWEVRSLGRRGGWMITAAMDPGRHAVVDALLPAVDAFVAHRALWRALADLDGAPRVRLYRWWPLADLPLRDEPIVPTEFVVGRAHAEWPPPYLQPGDTDVF